MVLRCLFRYLTHKVVDDFHFLLFLSIHFLHFADYNPADQTVQHGFVQFLNGSILADFMDKGLYIAFLGFCTAYQQRQVLQAFPAYFIADTSRLPLPVPAIPGRLRRSHRKIS